MKKPQMQNDEGPVDTSAATAIGVIVALAAVILLALAFF
jgi:hypothetical protein